MLMISVVLAVGNYAAGCAGGQAAPVPQLGEAQRRRAAAAAGVQVVPGHQQPGGRVGHLQRRVRRGAADHPGEDLREGAVGS